LLLRNQTYRYAIEGVSRAWSQGIPRLFNSR